MAAELDCNYPLLCRTPGTSSISSSSCRWQIQTFSFWIFSKHFSLLFYFLLNRSFHYSEFNRKFLLIFRVHRENTPAKASSMNQWLAQTHAHFIKLNYLLIIYGFQFASVDIPVRQLTHFSRSIFTLHFSSSIGLFFDQLQNKNSHNPLINIYFYGAPAIFLGDDFISLVVCLNCSRFYFCRLPRWRAKNNSMDAAIKLLRDVKQFWKWELTSN